MSCSHRLDALQDTLNELILLERNDVDWEGDELVPFFPIFFFLRFAFRCNIIH
jgi:hypothetical protein